MNVTDLETLLKGVMDDIDPEMANLSITFNSHAQECSSAREADKYYLDYVEWVSEDEHQRAIASNSVWTLEYLTKDTGYRLIGASSLQAVIDYVTLKDKV